MHAFHKMHGLGNDFAIFDARGGGDAAAMTPARARAVADRRRGIGCDQVIVLSDSEAADLHMRILNADGSEAGACGNAARCVAALVGGRPRIQTAGGIITALAGGGEPTIDMGAPRLDWDAIPLAYPMDTAALPLAWETLAAPMAVNVGNPHLVFFVADPDAVDLARLGPLIEHDPAFPERVNVNVAAVCGAGIALRVWERGAGLTQACGTGACATAVAAIRRRLARAPVAVTLPGGTMTIDWTPGGTIRMSGPATHVFSGTIDLTALA